MTQINKGSLVNQIYPIFKKKYLLKPIGLTLPTPTPFFGTHLSNNIQRSALFLNMKTNKREAKNSDRKGTEQAQKASKSLRRILQTIQNIRVTPRKPGARLEVQGPRDFPRGLGLNHIANGGSFSWIRRITFRLFVLTFPRSWKCLSVLLSPFGFLVDTMYLPENVSTATIAIPAQTGAKKKLLKYCHGTYFRRDIVSARTSSAERK